MKESTTYQEIIREGETSGALKEARKILLMVGKTHLGSADKRVENAINAIQAGATGLVYKEEAPEILIRAIRKVHSGEAWLSRAVMTSALSKLRNTRDNQHQDDQQIAHGTSSRTWRCLIESGAQTE